MEQSPKPHEREAKKMSRTEIAEYFGSTTKESDKNIAVDPTALWGVDAFYFQRKRNEYKSYKTTLESKNADETLMSGVQQLIEKAESGLHEALEFLRADFKRMSEAQQGRWVKIISQESRTLDPEIRRQLVEYFAKIVESGQESSEHIDGVPDDVLIALVENHVTHFEEAAKRFKEGLAKEHIREVHALMSRGIANGVLPISQERLDAVFQNTRVVMADDLHPNMERTGGYHEARADLIGVSARYIHPDEYIRERVDEVLAHEYLHALDGRIHVVQAERQPLSKEELAEEEQEMRREGVPENDIKARLHELEAEGDVAVRWRHAKRGLGFHRGASDILPQRRFLWLNEAVTERIVDELMPNRTHKTYGKFREALQYLMEEGEEQIPLALFTQAYFEEYDPNAPSTEKASHWKKLREAINRAHGPRFLVDFDKAANRYGDASTVTTALELARAGILAESEKREL